MAPDCFEASSGRERARVLLRTNARRVGGSRLPCVLGGGKDGLIVSFVHRAEVVL